MNLRQLSKAANPLTRSIGLLVSGVGLILREDCRAGGVFSLKGLIVEKPILFSTEMIQAILEGRKTQTRRVMRPQPFWGERRIGPTMEQPRSCWIWSPKKDEEWLNWGKGFDPVIAYRCPYASNTLWVRETWQAISPDENERPLRECQIIYKATDEHPGLYNPDKSDEPWYGWRPSIFMPRWASRIKLRVNNVRVEWVQDIDNHDSWAEGILPAENWPNNLICHNSYRLKNGYGPEARDMFAHLWNFFNAKRGYSWEVNPWVWVIEFQYIPVTVTE